MKWLAKAALQGTISVLPRSHEINYVFQRKVTKRLPRGPHDFDYHAETAGQHVDALAAHRPQARLAELRLYEFGAGWDLIGALSFWALGAEDQTLVDIRDNLRWELVNHTIEQLHDRHDALQARLGRPLRRPERSPVSDPGELADRFGIRYHAPRDARATGLPDGSVDLVTSTFTLEHIPAPDISAILTETRRIMARGGLMSSLIDLKDHYSYVDGAVGPYNFLRYSDRTWALLNPGLQWQSRQRHPEYLELFRAAGFATIADQPEWPTAEDLEALRGQPIHNRFRRPGWTAEQIGIKTVHLVTEPGA
jgi:hypothetical protein